MEAQILQSMPPHRSIVRLLALINTNPDFYILILEFVHSFASGNEKFVPLGFKNQDNIEKSSLLRDSNGDISNEGILRKIRQSSTTATNHAPIKSTELLTQNLPQRSDTGSLYHFVQTHKYEIQQSNVYMSLFQDLIDAYSHMSNHGCIYLDFKAENSLINADANNHATIVDFGMARYMRNASNQISNFEQYGTKYMSSPEILNGFLYNGPEADIWALGLVLLFMVTGGSSLPLSEVGSSIKYSTLNDNLSEKHGEDDTGTWQVLEHSTDGPCLVRFNADIVLPPKIDAKVSRILGRMMYPLPAFRASISEIQSLLNA